MPDSRLTYTNPFVEPEMATVPKTACEEVPVNNSPKTKSVTFPCPGYLENKKQCRTCRHYGCDALIG